MNNREYNFPTLTQIKTALEQLEIAWVELKKNVSNHVNSHYYALLFINLNKSLIENMMSTLTSIKTNQEDFSSLETSRRVYYISIYLSDMCNSLSNKDQFNPNNFFCDQHKQTTETKCSAFETKFLK